MASVIDHHGTQLERLSTALERVESLLVDKTLKTSSKAFALKNADIKNARAASVKFLASGYRQLLTLPTSKELACALSLTASQLAPAYEGVELRFGIKSFMRFLKQLEKEQEGEDGGETQSLEMLLATYPDYGQATEALLDSGRIAVPVLEDEEIEPLSIRAVHEQLMAIAKDEGAGGVARKQLLALRLLQKCRYPEERMFIVRMLAHQSLRIGMGEKSILAALASASFPSFDNRVGENDGVAGSDSLVQEKDWVEAVTLAYAQHPNYHTLAELLHADQQEENIAEKIRLLQNQARPITGVPVLTMSAYPVTSVAAVLDRVSKAKSRTATCEYKYDGARVQVHLSLPTDGNNSSPIRRIFSRNMEDVTDRFSSLLDVLQQHVVVRNSKVQDSSAVSSLIVEGEVVALDRTSGTFRPFQTIGKVGTGFSDAQLSEVAARLGKQVLPRTDEIPGMYQSQMIRSRHPDVWLSPGEVWEIKATQLTESPSYSCGVDIAVGTLEDAAAVPPRKGLALRFPRFVRYRPDKTPLQATDSEQVLELFNQQQQQTPH
ncbi:hypothetical protein JM18_002251 [Phytophthora kernoviae]|uniref:ATP-dependent DNA ligase family profile domain-containing protein n=1 Tax=Phytophthora kernoviae TaxID=325452 RepID=A0A922AR11_9STRA|nr:hypothetical protein JM18_002251 [Phytophthora kernoviae]